MTQQEKQPWYTKRYREELKQETFYNTGIPKRRYDSIHNSIRWKYGKASICIWDSTHVGRNYQWSNVSGVYSKDIEDYLPMCRSCHAKLDVSDKQRERMAKLNKGNPTRTAGPVTMFSKDGELIKTYNYLAEAARMTGISKTGIANCLKGRSKTAGGFVWKRI